jgi:hypothetical protein
MFLFQIFSLKLKSLLAEMEKTRQESFPVVHLKEEVQLILLSVEVFIPVENNKIYL